MDNRAYEQYKATQPVAPKPQRIEPEPLPDLTGIEITAIAVIVTLAVYALYHMIKDPVKKSSPTDKS
jgi:hypothetical protein